MSSRSAARPDNLRVNMELEGALAVSRNLGILSDRLPLFRKRAIGTLRRKIAVEARRDIQKEYNIRAGRARKDISVYGTGEGLRLIGHWRGIGLRNFSGRQVRKGVTAAILRGRRSLYPGAFMATLLGGNVQAVSRFGPKRTMTKGRYQGKKRQPLAVEYGATLAQMLAKGRRPERLAEYARGVLRDEIERQIEGYARGRPIPGADT